MKLELTSEVKSTIQSAVGLVKGASRRLFMASVVVQLDRGGQRLAAQELGWNRDLIRKGLHELTSGMTCVDAFSSRGRKHWEKRQPGLETDIRKIVEVHCETDPTFRTTRLYRRLTACRLVEFSAHENITIQLAYHPPYHSKYNPIERVFGVLESYWNGDPLRTVDKALGLARGIKHRAWQEE